MKAVFTLISLFLLAGFFLSSSCKKKTQVKNSTVSTKYIGDSGQIIVKVYPYKITALALSGEQIYCFCTQALRDTILKNGNPMANLPCLFIATSNTTPPNYASFILPADTSGTWYWFYTNWIDNSVTISKKDSFQLFPCNFRASGGCKDTLTMVCE